MNLGDRIKGYESQTTSIKLIDRLPIIVRLDGRSFSSFTKGLAKPFDERLSRLMIETTKYLVSEVNANCGYTQSDEITLVIYNDSYDSEVLFNRKLLKMTSILASMATGFFVKNLNDYLPEKAHLIPNFDCRIFNVPDISEAANCVLWREMDATRNSISMASECYCSHGELEGKNSTEKQEMLFAKGINWNDYPSFFKRGTYIQRKKKFSKFSDEELEKLPPKHNARKNPDLEIERWVIEEINMPPLTKVLNKEEVIISGAIPNLEKKSKWDEFMSRFLDSLSEKEIKELEIYDKIPAIDLSKS